MSQLIVQVCQHILELNLKISLLTALPSSPLSPLGPDTPSTP